MQKKTKSIWQFATLIMLTIVCVGLLAACGGEDKKAIATEVAKTWTDTSMSGVSGTVAELIIGEEPMVAQLAGGALAGLVRETLTWDYSEPERESEDRYAVTATATADVRIDVPLVADKRYVVSVPFNLDVDTNSRAVVSWIPDLRSGKFEERDE